MKITDSPDPVFVDDLVTYTITVTNHGPQDVTGVVVTVVGPAGDHSARRRFRSAT